TYPVPFEDFVDRARDRLGYVWCCLDSARSRSVLQTELPSVIANGGTADSAWTFSLHEYDRPNGACLQDLYPEIPARPLDSIQEVVAHLGIDPEAARQLIRPNRPVDWRLLAGVIARENNFAKRQQLLQLGGRRLQEVVAGVCATMKPAPQAPAATISFVALMPSIAMVADLLKRRLYGWHPTEDDPNLFYFDTFLAPSRGRAMKAVAGRRCLCRMPHYRGAFAMRQALRAPHLGRIFEAPAEEPTPPPPPSAQGEKAAGKARGAAAPRNPPPARDAVGNGPPGAAAVNSRIGVAALRTGARLLWLAALAVHLASFAANGLAIGALLDPSNPLKAAWQPLQLVKAAASADSGWASWLAYSGMCLVPIVIQWMGLLFAVAMVAGGGRAYARTVPPNEDNCGLRWARRLLRFFGVTAVPAHWLGAATWLTITARCVAPLLWRLGCFACILIPVTGILAVTGLVHTTLLPGRFVRGLVGQRERKPPSMRQARRVVRR
ncbi:MAG: hypothetical protein IMZ55_00445, partial [Acidobacteria bacterium]|nr:hypothetical protein [Acidobacteriota bacterium]